MGASKRGRLAVLVLLVVASIGVAAAPAGALPATFDVVVGQPLEGAPAESMRFLPDRLSVAQGDTINFSVGPAHTTTLLPSGQVPENWIEDFANDLDDEWSFPTSDPDEGADAVRLNNSALLPTCGPPGFPPCSYDGTSVVNSGFTDPAGGVPVEFSVPFDVAPGTTVWALCLVHNRMRMRIDVVEEAERSDPGEVAASVEETIAKDTDWAQATDRRLRTTRTSHENAEGQKVWDVYAGFDNKGVALFDFYPSRLRIRRGQLVRFRYDSLLFENHTATFPLERLADEPFVTFNCDPDGDGPGPDNPPELPGPPFCMNPTQLEVDLNPNIVAEQGNGVFRGGDDFENSGERGEAFEAVELSPYGSDEPWDLKFGKKSQKGGFRYFCGIHPFMRGRVDVKKR